MYSVRLVVFFQALRRLATCKALANCKRVVPTAGKFRRDGGALGPASDYLVLSRGTQGQSRGKGARASRSRDKKIEPAKLEETPPRGAEPDPRRLQVVAATIPVEVVAEDDLVHRSAPRRRVLHDLELVAAVDETGVRPALRLVAARHH